MAHPPLKSTFLSFWNIICSTVKNTHRYLLQSFKIIFQLSLKHCVFLFHELIKPIIQNNIFIILPNKIHRDHMWQTWLGLGGPNYAELELHTNIGKVARSSNFLIHHMKSWTQPGWGLEIYGINEELINTLFLQVLD